MKLNEVAEEEEVHLHHLHEAHHQVHILRATQLQHQNLLQLQRVHTQKVIQLQQLPQHQLAHIQKAMEHQRQLQRLVILLHLLIVNLIQATLLQHDKLLHVQL